MFLEKLWNNEPFEEGELEKAEKELSEQLEYDEVVNIDKETLTAVVHQKKPISWFDKLMGIKRFITFHVSLKKEELGKPLYDKNFKMCGPFEEKVSPVKNKDGWFHINTSGERIYQQTFDCAGGFRNNKAPVMKEKDGNREFFLINKEGERISKKYSTFRNMRRWEAPGGLHNPI